MMSESVAESQQQHNGRKVETALPPAIQPKSTATAKSANTCLFLSEQSEPQLRSLDFDGHIVSTITLFLSAFY